MSRRRTRDRLQPLPSLLLCLFALGSFGCATISGSGSPADAAQPGEPAAEPAAGPATPEAGAASADGAAETAADAPADTSADTSASADATSNGVPPQAQRSPVLDGMGERAQSGLEGMIIGTVIGGQIAGPHGAAVGAAVVGLYGLITGTVPFDNGRRSRGARGRRSDVPPEEALEREIEDELERQRALESEIEEELRKHEDLLEAITRQEELSKSVQVEEERRAEHEASDDPLAAPPVPYERDLPDSIFDRETRTIGKEERLVKTLDADRDGRPEIQIIYDAKSGELLSRSDDTDYDGMLDTQTTYDETGRAKSRSEDANHDGMPDRWIDYTGTAASRVEVDRDFDGKRDGFYVYKDGVLAYEEHDTNGDTKIDRRVEYADRRRTREIEDTDFNGKMDFTSFYNQIGVPARTERDKDEDGQTDIWEFYEGEDPARIKLSRKEEDTNGDGNVDVTSYYRKGKLVRRVVQE